MANPRPGSDSEAVAVRSYLSQIDQLMGGEGGILQFEKENMPGGAISQKRRELNVLEMTDVVQTAVDTVLNRLQVENHTNTPVKREFVRTLYLLKDQMRVKELVNPAKMAEDARRSAQERKSLSEREIAQKTLSCEAKKAELLIMAADAKPFTQKLVSDLESSDLDIVFSASQDLFRELRVIQEDDELGSEDKIKRSCQKIGVKFGILWRKNESKLKALHEFTRSLEKKLEYLRSARELASAKKTLGGAMANYKSQIDASSSIVREKLNDIQALLEENAELATSFSEDIQGLCANSQARGDQTPLNEAEERAFDGLVANLADLERVFAEKAEELRKLHLKDHTTELERYRKSRGVAFDQKAAEIDAAKAAGNALTSEVVLSLKVLLEGSVKDIRDSKIQMAIIRAIDALLQVIEQTDANGKNKWPDLDSIKKTVLGVNDAADLEKIYPELTHELVRSILNVYRILEAHKNDAVYRPEVFFGIMYAETMDPREKAEVSLRDKNLALTQKLKEMNDQWEKGLIALKNSLPGKILAIDVALSDIRKRSKDLQGELIAEEQRLEDLMEEKNTLKSEHEADLKRVRQEEENTINQQNDLRNGDKSVDGSIESEIEKHTHPGVDGRLHRERIIPKRTLETQLQSATLLHMKIKTDIAQHGAQNSNNELEEKLRLEIERIKGEMKEIDHGYKKGPNGTKISRDNIPPSDLETLKRGDGGIDISEDADKGTFFRSIGQFAAYLRRSIREKMEQEIDSHIREIKARAQKELQTLETCFGAEMNTLDQKIHLQKGDLELRRAEIEALSHQIALLEKLKQSQGEVNTSVQNFHQALGVVYEKLRSMDSGNIAQAVKTLAEVRTRIDTVYSS